MNQLSTSHDDDGTEWLFGHAREYPLLSAEEEKDIDEKKWQARDALLNLFLTDTHGRLFLQRWVNNLLQNPPDLKDFAEKEYYYLLRREHAELVKESDNIVQLESLHALLASSQDVAPRAQLMEVLSQLNVSPLLVAGFADVLLGSDASGEIAAALRYWQKFWQQADDEHTHAKEQTPFGAAHRQAMRRQVQAYFAAREQLVNHNLRLVFSIAGKLQSTTVPYLDRVQSGVLGLIRAAEKYDHRTGHRFSTYAYNWISQSARRMLEEQRAIVRLPAGVSEQINRLYRERLSHLNTSGKEASVEVLAERLEMKPEAVARLQQTGNLSVSLDTPFGNEPDGLTLGDTLTGWTYSPPAAKAEQVSLNRILLNSLDSLAPQEKSVIELRWGLDNSPPLSRRELAEHLRVSTERIRQLEKSALGKLRDDDEVAEAFRDYQDIQLQD